MRTRVFYHALIFSVALLVGTASAHTLFVKPDTFIVGLQETMHINVINGTFLKSENRVRKDMVKSAEIIGPGNKQHEFADDDWLSVDKTSVLRAQFDEAGNYIIAIETRPRKISLDPDEFNFYLRYEGLQEQQENRIELGEAETAVVEKYTKFAKAIVQVGGEESSNFATELGFDVEA